MKIIVIEGNDGSGKSVVARGVVKALREQYGVNAKYIHFPNENGFYGKRIYEFLNGDVIGYDKSPIKFSDIGFMTQWMLYALDRQDFFVNNKNDLWNAVLICDRYTTSSTIYQLVGLREFHSDVLNRSINEYRGKKDPSLTLTIDLLKEKLKDVSDIKKWFDGDRWIAGDEFPEYSVSAANMVLHILQTEYHVMGIPVPNEIYYIIREGERTLSTSTQDEFENIEFAKQVDTIGDLVAEKSGWKKIVNRYLQVNQTISEIVSDIAANVSISMSETIKYEENILTESLLI